MSKKLFIPSIAEIAEKDLEYYEEFLQSNAMAYTIKLVIEGKNNGSQLFIKSIVPAKIGTLCCAMILSEGNQSRASRLLGISRGTMRQYLLRYFDLLDIGTSDNIGNYPKIL